MELSYQRIINVPPGYAFARATDFDRFEAEGFGNLAPFEPRNEIRAPEIGARWRTAAEFQGRPRRFSLELIKMEGPRLLVLGNKTEKYDVEARMIFDEAENGATAFDFKLDAKARSITAKLILQTIQLAKGRIAKTMQADFDKMALRMEAAYQADA
jgi:hypothetical protein